jgi:hypothetical protein
MDLDTLLHNLTLHSPTPEMGEKMDDVRTLFKTMAIKLYETVPSGRQREMMATELEMACRHAIAGIVGCR